MANGGSRSSMENVDSATIQPMEKHRQEAPSSPFRVNRALQIGYSLSILLWVSLLVGTLYVAPKEAYERLYPIEIIACWMAAGIQAVSVMSTLLLPLLLGCGPGRNASHLMIPEGIVVAGLVVQVIAMLTNFHLATRPAIVLIDPITQARVFVLRWVEWISLSALMKLLSEVIDAPDHLEAPTATNKPRLMACFLPSISCVCGLLLPLAPTPSIWLCTLLIAVAAFAPIVYNAICKYRRFRAAVPPSSLGLYELYIRQKYAMILCVACASFWSLLVVFYFLNILVMHSKMVHPEHWLRHPSVGMLSDTTFDVLAKVVYLKLILEVHRRVFETDGQVRRHLIWVLWNSTADVIVIVTQTPQGHMALFSPSFVSLIDPSRQQDETDREDSLLIQLGHNMGILSASTVASSKALDQYPWETAQDQNQLDIHSLVVSEAVRTIHSAMRLEEDLVLRGMDGHEKICEFSLSGQVPQSLIVGILRDVTARQLKTRRQEADTFNRFTRHEVKNGILACIELCNTLQESSDTQQRKAPLNELNSLLTGTLQTVMADVLAREIITESYRPKLGRCNIRETLLATCPQMGTEQFPLVLYPESMLDIETDQQLLQYVHRNALSNAIKYGKQGGIVRTQVFYDNETNYLELRIVNEPGDGHSELVLLGEEATHAVFQKSRSLHQHLESSNKNVSTGDGAWIIQKCCKTLKGKCAICFEAHCTIFSMSFPCNLILKSAVEEAQNFSLNEDAFAVAVDDSGIQRKIMLRHLVAIGFRPSHVIVLGETLDEVHSLPTVLSSLLKDFPSSQILVLMDEMLDFGETCVSGSRLICEVYDSLEPRFQKRILRLVRSANDSPCDLATYALLTDGFLSKAPMTKDGLRQTLAPLWCQRFERELPATSDQPPQKSTS